MKTTRYLITIICVIQTACQAVATSTQPPPTKITPTSTLAPTVTAQPTAVASATFTPTMDPNLNDWNGLLYDIRKWRVITYNETEWTPQTYPVHTLEPVLTHRSIEKCMIYLEEGRDMPGWIIKEVPVVIGGHIIFDERIFQDSNGQDHFMVIVGSYHVDLPQDESKSECIKDAERVVMTGMGLKCPSGNCGYCPGLPRTNLKVGDMVKLFNAEMALPVTEPGGNQFAGNMSDWDYPEYTIEVIDGPVCLNDNAWWQLRSPNDITGWDSDDHFIIEP